MPPHMHPRSLTTASLFTTTLLFSFLVVAAPHLVPCPVDPRTLTDSPDPRRRRRIRQDANTTSGEQEQRTEDMTEERRMHEQMLPKRECPIPKPGGLVGAVLGVRRGEGRE